MDYRSWEPWYEAIREAFGYSLEADRRAAELLDELLADYDLSSALARAEEALRDRRVVVFGAGPNLEDHIAVLSGALRAPGLTVMAADGATRGLLEAGLRPDIITTDLDGDIEALREANRAGSLVVIHAHGDNMPALLAHARSFRNGLTLGTCQTEPVGRVMNFGGFTDGDRAVFMAFHLGADRVLLAGWHFGGLVGRFSKPWLDRAIRANCVKRMKLDFARRLLSWLAELYPGRLFVLEEVIPGAITLGQPELAEFLGGGRG